jgi:putative aminopeptidase FrvX
MNVKEKFLELTSRTYPHGTEKELFHLLGDGLTEDEFGNLFIKIGESDVMFTSHLDTATSALTKVNHVFDKNIIKTDGKSILGADDKAGVTIMLYMIEKEVPGLYYFFLGEEVGCIGSKKVANKLQTEKIEGINKVISFDRRGTTSVITYQSSQRCASDKFGEALALELNKAE